METILVAIMCMGVTVAIVLMLGTAFGYIKETD